MASLTLVVGCSHPDGEERFGRIFVVIFDFGDSHHSWCEFAHLQAEKDSCADFHLSIDEIFGLDPCRACDERRGIGGHRSAEYRSTYT